MKVIFFSTKQYDEEYFTRSNNHYNHEPRFVEAKLTFDTVNLINGESTICVFVNDVLERKVTLTWKRPMNLV